MIRLLIPLLVACSSHPPAKRKPEPAANATPVVTAAPARDCKTEATELGAFLAKTTEYEGPLLMAQRDVHLVKRTDLPIGTIARSPVIVATATETRFMGALVSGRAELVERLRAMRPRESSPVILLQLDEATPWGTVVELVTAAEVAGFTTPAFAFVTDHKLTPPPRSPVDDKLDAFGKDAAINATQLGQIVREIIEPCPALIRAFGAGGGANALVAAVAPSLIECDCKVDMASLRSVMWRVLAVAPTVQVIAFDETRGETLALPRATTWAEASKQLRPGTKGMKLVAK